MRQSVFGHLILATLIFSTLLISGVLLVSHFTVMQGITDAERATAPEVAEKNLFLHEVDRIDKLIDRLDDGFISSEKVWQYLHKKHEKFEDTSF